MGGSLCITEMEEKAGGAVASAVFHPVTHMIETYISYL